MCLAMKTCHLGVMDPSFSGVSEEATRGMVKEPEYS